MANVSTDFSPVPANVYELKIDGVQEETEDGRTHYTVVLLVQDVGDLYGKKIKDRIYIHKKNGEINEYGLAQLKRYFEATVGEDRANADDADTDELLNNHIRAQVGIEDYEVDNALTGQKEKRQRNRIEAIAPMG